VDLEARRLRGLEVDYNLELVLLHNRKFARFRTFEHFPRIDAGEPIHIGEVQPVAHQAAVLDIFSEVINGGHRVARRQRDELFAARVKKWVAGPAEGGNVPWSVSF